MEKDLKKLKQFGNLLEKLLNPQEKIYLLRVYGYESYVGNVYYQERKDYMNTKEEKQLLEVFQIIRKEVNKQHWDDNKIVVEVVIGSWRVFIGYWDENLTLGGSVVPNFYLPKFKEGRWGAIEKISIR